MLAAPIAPTMFTPPKIYQDRDIDITLQVREEYRQETFGICIKLERVLVQSS